jgi:hypothetical protein
MDLGRGHRDRSIRARGRLREQQLEFVILAGRDHVEFRGGDHDV